MIVTIIAEFHKKSGRSSLVTTLPSAPLRVTSFSLLSRARLGEGAVFLFYVHSIVRGDLLRSELRIHNDTRIYLAFDGVGVCLFAFCVVHSPCDTGRTRGRNPTEGSAGKGADVVIAVHAIEGSVLPTGAVSAPAVRVLFVRATTTNTFACIYKIETPLTL